MKDSYEALAGPTPCKVNPEVFSSSLLDDFDSRDFIETHPELEGDALEKALTTAEASHTILHDNAVSEAVALCKECPVIDTCRRWVLNAEKSAPVYGVVAAMQPHERKKLRRRIERNLKKA